MKKEIVIPVLLIILGLVFVIINALVFVFKGNPRLIKRKLKVGAMILTLSSIAACHTIPERTCYKVSISPIEDNNDTISIANKEDSIKIVNNQSRINDSIAKINEENRKKDSIANIKSIKGDTIQPTCYKMPPQKTCYAPVRNKPE